MKDLAFIALLIAVMGVGCAVLIAHDTNDYAPLSRSLGSLMFAGALYSCFHNDGNGGSSHGVKS